MGDDSSCGALEALMRVENALLFLKMEPSYFFPNRNSPGEQLPDNPQMQLIADPPAPPVAPPAAQGR
jgi:hypothetical protein